MRKLTVLSILFILSAIIYGGFPQILNRPGGIIASAQNGTAGPAAATKPANDQKPGSPHVNYVDSAPAIEASEQIFPGAAVKGAAADFDSDGVKDMIVADSSGKLSLFRGNADTIYPNTPEAKQRRSSFGEPKPFIPTETVKFLPMVPDHLFAGDLNGDGYSDIVAATRNADHFYVLMGGGMGNFSDPIPFPAGGRITAMAAGEIGRKDQNLDLAIAFEAKGRSFIAIYEHPEGAFRVEPAVYIISSPATALAIGNLDRDNYRDVAAASGNLLTVVHGRGNPYPLDWVQEANIRRPDAVVQSHRMSFQIADIAAGNFGERYGESLMLLGADGRLVHLDPQRDKAAPISRRLKPEEVSKTEAPKFIPTDPDIAPLRVPKEQAFSPETADEMGQIFADSSDLLRDRQKVFDDKVAELKRKLDRLPAAERSRVLAERVRANAETAERRKRLFEEMLSPQPILLTRFREEAVAEAGRFAAEAASGVTGKLIRGRFSDSGVDDIAVAGGFGSIHIAGRWARNEQAGRASFDIATIETGSAVSHIVPMRLNPDGLSDLVILGSGTAAPRVAMSEGTTVLIVNTTDDQTFGDCLGGSEPCGLRRAIQQANFFGGNFAEIRFNIPGSGPFKFEPTSPYPSLRRPTLIDGTTQPGFTGTPIIEIDGTNMNTSSAEGIRVQASNSVIRGLVINNMPALNYDGQLIGGSGIVVLSTNIRRNIQNVTIEGNRLGTNVDGTARRPNWANGILIYDAYLNTIGGTVPQARNLLSGNGNYTQTNKSGVGLAITAGHENKIQGNYIGTDASGNVKVRNDNGMFLAGIANEFGGNEAGAGNVVSGNGGELDQFGKCDGDGIGVVNLFNLVNGESVSYDNLIRGNLIGTNASGLAGLGNCSAGIFSYGNINTQIGSMAASGRNTISDNGYDAVHCGFNESFFELISGFCFIAGNNIGTNVSGNSAIPNDKRNRHGGFIIMTGTVWITPSDIDFAIVGSPGGTTPNGPCTGFCNLVSGNYSPWSDWGGIYRSGGGQAFLFNNMVGTNKAGTSALPNDSGINAYFSATVIGGPIFDGKNTISGGNLVSGNRGYGIWARALESGTFISIRGNRVGLSSDGLSGISNGVGGTQSYGINTYSAATATIIVGGTDELSRNIVAATISDSLGNGTWGIGINVSSFGRSEVIGNWIGLNAQGMPVGNTGDGIRASGNGDTRIGGPSVGEGNVIKNNGRAGVAIIHNTATRPEKIKIRGNAIANNGGLGIDLMNASHGNYYPSGVTPNDCDDSDVGANNLQNYPELFTPVQNQDGTLRIDTILRSSPSRSFTIDYYLNIAADPTNYGEGESYLGSIQVMTNGNGFVSAAFNTPIQLLPTAIITATATDEDGNTSEFACYAGQCFQSAGFTEAIERAELGLQCIEPIVVNVEGNEADLDGDLPIQQRDGLCDVDANTPGEQCTLRAAIQEANARTGYNLINFDIPGGGIRTIIVPNTDLLPEIKSDVDINGLSQPGWSGAPMIQLQGEIINQTAPARGLTVGGSNITIRGLAISKFGANISMFSSSAAVNNNRVENCYVGLNADGSFDPNTPSVIGVSILGTANTTRDNRIGSAFNGNVIGNNSSGIVIAGTNARFNQVLGNKIGTTPSGTLPAPNEVGVVVGSGARENTIGAELNNGGNVISGNIGHGVTISSNATLNKVTGNFIGTRPNGLDRLANGFQGVAIIGGANNNTIGGPNDLRNIISGNNGSEQTETAHEVFIDAGANNNTVAGNFIGLKINWSEDFGVPIGVMIQSSGNTIGGSTNVQNDFGVGLAAVLITPTEGNTLFNNKISYNRIGTRVVGQQAGNGQVGIALRGDVRYTKINDNQISGNSVAGLLIFDGPLGSSISRNKIGTDVGGGSAIPNGVGVSIIRSSNNELRSNLISGNRLANVYLGEEFQGSNFGIRNVIRTFDVYSPEAKRVDGSVSTQYNTIKANRIGTNSAGTEALSNGGAGIILGEGARENQIGGNRVSGEGNIISGHTAGDLAFGVYIGSLFETPSQELPSENWIQGNTIGLGQNGEFIGNGVGIKITGGSNNIIGAEPGCVPKNECEPSNYANVIGGNTNEGISVESQNSADTKINGNLVGVRDGGAAAANGGDGIKLSSVGYTEVEGNTIGNSGQNGLFIEDPNNVMQRSPDLLHVRVKVTGNVVGILKSVAGQNPILAPNGQAGVLINNVPNVLVGAFNSDEAKNIIAGNLSHGVRIVGSDARYNTVNHSYIGTDQDSTLNIGNGGDGVRLESAILNTVGDPDGDPEKAPTIGGNQRSGIALVNASAFNTLQGALVGVNRAFKSTLAVPNVRNGIEIINASNNRVGNALLPIKNLIGKNQLNGIFLSGPGAQLNQIVNNQIGGTGLGNQLHGVHVTAGANNNTIGGEAPNQGNQIFENGGNGIFIDEPEEPKRRRVEGTIGTINNRILFNEISMNVGLGIDIGEPGRTDNDPGDPDEGPNRGQNYPQLENLHIDSFNRVLVDVRVDSHPDNQNYGTNGIRIDFYRSDLQGQGARYLTSEFWTVQDFLVGGNYVQYDLGNATDLGITPADRITAIATDADGNSSEFFPVEFAPTSAGVSVSGRVTMADGRPLQQIAIEIVDTEGNKRRVMTNTFGYYVIEGVAAGRSYVLSAKSRRYRFTPADILISVTDPIDNANFIGSE